MTLKRYLRNLANHPGLGYASFFTLLGAMAGRGSPRGMLAGSLIMSIFWIPVFITSWHFYDERND
jgi:hypothetical protein